MNRALTMGTFACALVACRGQVVNLGTSDAGTPTVASGQTSAFSATWTGYIQAYTLPSGSDALTIVLATQSDGSLTGTVTFGDKPPPPPPTDPNIGYPPATDMADASFELGDNVGPVNVPSIEGFHYTAQNVMVSMDGSRVQLDVATYELWKAWCALQTPYPWPQDIPEGGLPSGQLPPPAYGCDQEPNGSEYSATKQCIVDTDEGMDVTPIDCGKVQLCNIYSVCTCSKTSCAVDTIDTDVHFDLQLQGSSLDGAASTTGVPLECCPGNLTLAPTTPPIDGHNILLTRSP
jgi:hypothetical protein